VWGVGCGVASKPPSRYGYPIARLILRVTVLPGAQHTHTHTYTHTHTHTHTHTWTATCYVPALQELGIKVRANTQRRKPSAFLCLNKIQHEPNSLQIYNTSLLDKYLQSQLLCLLTQSLLCLTTCFGPTGHHQVITNKTFSTYLQEDFFPQRIRCL
jgi:hypothetical protein